MRARRVGAIVSVLFAFAACGLSGLDGATGGTKDAGAAGVDAGDPVDGRTLSPTDSGSTPEAATTDAQADAGQSYRALILADRPTAYVPFDDPAGSTTALEVISNTKGAVTGDFVFGVPGVSGTAAHSPGDGTIDFGQLMSLTGETPWSFEAWMLPIVDFSVATAFYNVYDKRDGTTNGMVIYVRSDANPQAVIVQLEQDWDDGTGTNTTLGRGTSIALPALDHMIYVVFTYQPAVGVRAWADGFKGSLGYDADGGPTAAVVDSVVAGGLRGTIDELAFYNYVLSDDQIATHYAKGRLSH